MNELEFEKWVKENEDIIYHFINKYQIKDTDGEFYQEGLLAIWEAWRNYDETKAKRSTHTYTIIRGRLLSKMHRNYKYQDQTSHISQAFIVTNAHIAEDHYFEIENIAELRAILSKKERIWFDGYILNQMPLKSIAQETDSSIVAVKSWGVCARKRIREYIMKNWEGNMI